LVFRDTEFQCTDTVVEFTTFLIQLPSVDSETSNQAMQLTAGRSDTSRMVNRTCNLQPRSVSPAVADLVSR